MDAIGGERERVRASLRELGGEIRARLHAELDASLDAASADGSGTVLEAATLACVLGGAVSVGLAIDEPSRESLAAAAGLPLAGDRPAPPLA